MIKIHCNGLDVWGNPEDGFEINDVLGWCGTISVSDLEHKTVILALLEGAVIWPGEYAIDDFGGDGLEYFANLIDRKTGKPLLQLRGV